jgi:GNAT superfamily N-acetyltransferase
MIRTAWPHDLPALRALFARANDTPYDLVTVAEEKCFGLGFAGQPCVRVWDESNVEGAIVTCGRYVRLIVVDRSARRRGIASALLADAESRGAHVIAAEPGNYFTPGVPMDNEEARRFFHARGYIETRWTYNLDVGLDGITAAEANGVRRPSHEESDGVLEFVEREFGQIWRFEASKAFESEVPQAVISEERGAITGFAVHDVNNRGLGFFGPTGVAKSLRGRGFGCALLLASLADMRRLGFSRAVIPWTDALEFYRKCSGAEPAHRFAAFAKEL